MAKVMTANLARALANSMKDNSLFKEIMENIFRAAVLGKHCLIVARSGQSTDSWEVAQTWLIGLEYEVEATPSKIIIRW
jgi:hypothetical protein